MDTKTKTKTPAEPATQVELWKKKYGEVFRYAADGLECFLKRPDRNIISLATMEAREDTFRFAEIVLDNCFLAGDQELRTVDKYFMGLAQVLNELVEVKLGELKKL